VKASDRDRIVKEMAGCLKVDPDAAAWFIEQFGPKHFGWNDDYQTFDWTMPDDVYEVSCRDLGYPR